MLQAEEPVSKGLSGDCCKNCGATGQNPATWCRQCGYYPVLGRCVDLDQEWEAALDPNSAQNQAGEEKMSLALFFRSIPRWVWPVMAVALVAIGVTLAGRMLTPGNSMLRVHWAFTHLVLSALVFLFAQGWACVKAASNDSQFGLLDAVLRPFAIWKPAIADMPRSLRMLQMSVFGITAFVAVLAIGGFPYDYIFEEEIYKPRPERKLEQAIAIQKQKLMAQKQEEDLAAGAAGEGEKKEDEPERLLSQDCVIFGYVPSGSAQTGFASLLVAAPVGKGKDLQFVATLDEGFTPEVRADLLPKLEALACEEPFVSCHVPGAVWVNPSLTCRVRFAEWTENFLLKKPSLEGLLQKVDAATESQEQAPAATNEESPRTE